MTTKRPYSYARGSFVRLKNPEAYNLPSEIRNLFRINRRHKQNGSSLCAYWLMSVDDYKVTEENFYILIPVENRGDVEKIRLQLLSEC